MNWPGKEDCRRIANLWARATGSAYPGESRNAWDALKRIQTELALDEVELIFIAEFWAREPTETRLRPDQSPERSPNVLELIMDRIENDYHPDASRGNHSRALDPAYSCL